MTYTAHDAEVDEFYEQISKELYPEHKELAIEEFTAEKLKSYYLGNTMVMRPAVDAIQEGRWLVEHERYSPATVFYVSAIELLLKATILRPILYGLIHNEGLAEIMTNHILGQSGVQRYEKLLAELYRQLSGIELKLVSREGTDLPLLTEVLDLQSVRNRIIHQGATCTEDEANRSHLVAVAVFDEIVSPMLHSIGLTVIAKGEIVEP